MFNKKINIITGVNPVNYEYFFYFIDNIRKTASNQNEIKVRVLTGPSRGGGSVLTLDQISKIQDKNVEVINGNHLANLGESLNYLVKIDELRDGEITLISDIDVAMLKKNWDVDIVLELEKFDTIGLVHEETSMFSRAGTPDTAIRYHGKPTVIWLAFKNNEVWKNLDFRHDKNNESPVDEIDAKLYEIPEGAYLARDTGWQIPAFLKKYNLSYSIIKNINRHSKENRILFHDIPHDLPWGDGSGKSGWPCDEGILNNRLFLAHQKLSQKMKFKKTNVSRIFYDLVDKYVE